MPTLKNIFQRIPFIRISGLFILGILISQSIRNIDLWVGTALVLLISLLMLLWNNKHSTGIKLQNILISLALFLSGIFYPNKDFKSSHFFSNQKESYIAELCQRPSEKMNSYQSVMLIKSKVPTREEKIIAYFSKERFDTTLMAGDQLIIHASLQEIRAKVNPFDFDYKAMMQNKGIYYSVYLSPGAWQKTGIQSNRVIYLAERVRDKLTGLLYETTLKLDERAVVSALTLGYRAEIDRETMNSFADTGTIHVLSVSGLHVALIFYILTLFLSPLRRGRFAGFIYPVVIIFCLWSYAFITGFSPSVQRSTVMFSFVIIGNLLRRPVNIYNSLMASALCLILLDPNVLFDIGFQLSYLAMFGIVLLQPPLESLISIKNKCLKWAWTLFTVSIAAQLITFPLSIFYFNQFPNLFWLSNFLAIPATTFIIWLTILFFAFIPVTFISNLLAGLIQFITHIMLVILKWISQLPHAVNEGIVYNPYQTLWMYGLIFAIVIYCFSKKKIWIFIGLCLLILFQTSSLWTKFGLFNQRMVYQYHTKSSIIHCINGRKNYILRTDNRPFDFQEIQLIQNACARLKLQRPKIILLNDRNYFSNNDIAIKNNILNFLNCQIIINDQLICHIRGQNIKEFQQNNPRLPGKISTHYPLVQAKLAEQETSCSIDFMIPGNEAVCICLN